MVRAEANKKSVVIDVLAASFDDNRSVNYVVKQDAKRKNRIRDLAHVKAPFLFIVYVRHFL